MPLREPVPRTLGDRHKLAQFVEQGARTGVSNLIALSTQAFAYFQSKAGFGEGGRDDLPPPGARVRDRSGRNSKVLIKHLRPAG